MAANFAPPTMTDALLAKPPNPAAAQADIMAAAVTAARMVRFCLPSLSFRHSAAARLHS